MPELPEVETIRRQLEHRVVGASIADAGAHWSDKFSPAVEVVGGEIMSAHRRGKYLLFDLDHGVPTELIVHLGMTGRLAVHDARDETDLTHPHLRAWWRFDDGRLFTFHDIRRFGRIHVVDAGRYGEIPTLYHLGPEPWDAAFTGRALAAFVKGSNRYLKTILLAQRAVAGIGNIYADEALWMAGINPANRRLSAQRADRLVETIRAALQSGLDHGGTTLRDYVDSDGETGANQHELFCYGRAGSPCHRCATELRSRVLDARTTTYCPRCQAR
ncbi:MAG: bifunctional DNA-formamidopyrimidine glycosylase/DNA-(apurinic or apyrimidinic site) lyase [Acidimicrobiales bacterium]|nr:bifunctional DNA-formamidopyrimidine glycosylase/DNA-(apurinic or apyrimidinic site) lyase [Acidimicrobiales bacterium]